MAEKISNFRDSVLIINTKAREIFVWFNNLCYNNRSWIVPILEIILLSIIMINAYTKIPKDIEKKHPGSPYPNLWRFAFSMLLAVIIYYMSK